MRDGATSRTVGTRVWLDRVGLIVERLAQICLVLILLVHVLLLPRGPLPAEARDMALVVFAPTLDRTAQMTAVAAAHGRPVTATLLPNAMVALPEDDRFGERIRTAGAWAVFPTSSFAGCLTGAWYGGAKGG